MLGGLLGGTISLFLTTWLFVENDRKFTHLLLRVADGLAHPGLFVEDDRRFTLVLIVSATLGGLIGGAVGGFVWGFLLGDSPTGEDGRARSGPGSPPAPPTADLAEPDPRQPA